ncbi:hypothetical protein [Streptomyces uncialis]|uniref:hypothetical protein n=1 Tax=Streptomyces uncialis TaxID=1048205 RepID=UPI003869E715|nr:hypothetical protein OG268_24955 [Streptomyces uncialis]
MAVFEDRVGRSARTLLGSQGFDGGWGLTLTSVSSVVNTSEVLPVLRVAGLAGEPVRRALDFLSDAIAEHCRPRQKGGRGEHTRFVAFGLAGLLSHPRFFHHDRVADTVVWCVDWLEDQRTEHGWPEVLGLGDSSLHQTALVVRSLAQLRDTLHDLGPGLRLTAGTDTGGMLERIEPLIGHGVRGLLYHRRPSGAWGWRTYVDTDPSPSKTALCLLAFAAVRSGTGPGGEPAYKDLPQETGGVHGTTRDRRLSEVITEASQWLLRNHHRWETFVEDDKDVQGTAWEHMAYALCAQAVVHAGVDPRDTRLSRAWHLMDGLWDPEAGMWAEPGGSGRRATIRATYWTVAAYEDCLARLARIGLTDTSEPGEPGSEIRISHAVPGPNHTVLLRLPDNEDPVACVLSERLFDLVRTVYAAPGGTMATGEIAQSLFVARSSVPKYVQRVNAAVSAAIGGAPARLLLPHPIGGAAGYRLAGR